MAWGRGPRNTTTAYTDFLPISALPAIHSAWSLKGLMLSKFCDMDQLAPQFPLWRALRLSFPLLCKFRCHFQCLEILSNLLVSPLTFCLCLWVFQFLFFCCHLNWIKEEKKEKREHSPMFNQKRSSWTLNGLGDNVWPSDCWDYPSDYPEPV